MNFLQEYPRPQMVRDSYINLNGEWQAAFTPLGENPAEYDLKICVPFSPEAKLSGVGRTLTAQENLWYKRTFSLPESGGVRTLLHFGAVDRFATVYVNGQKVGSHMGGYNAFYFDITEFVNDGENELCVCVCDDTDKSEHSRGKQKSARGGIWYTPQSGIWQTVWIEQVPHSYITAIKVTPLFDESAVDFYIEANEKMPCKILLEGGEFYGDTLTHLRIPLENFVAWTPENPHLYDYTATAGKDSVKGYFGMRKFSVEPDENGVKRLFLNGRPYFHTGLLDQGYWPDGLYTPPTDKAMIDDIMLAKKMGFNMLRKHIKVEPMRWYYHCDRLGMLVWQDMINGGGNYNLLAVSMPLVLDEHIKDNHYGLFARKDKACREQYYTELLEMVNQLYSCVSIAMWVPFNEGWGQFDAAKAVELIKSIDTTRTIDHASGWHDQKIGDFRSWHVYFRPYKFKKDKLSRAVILTEFGGYNLRVEGHNFNDKNFGYKGYGSAEELMAAFEKLYNEQIIPAKEKGLCATVYTQLSDVEDELNGLVTYDREVVKLPFDKVCAINEKLKKRG